jgi:hypothetical protein
MNMLFAYPFSIQITAALLAAVMVFFGGTRWVARRTHVHARIDERCARMGVDSSCRTASEPRIFYKPAEVSLRTVRCGPPAPHRLRVPR